MDRVGTLLAPNHGDGLNRNESDLSGCSARRRYTRARDKEIAVEVQNAKEASVQAEFTPQFDGDQKDLGQIFSRHKNQLYWTAFCVLGSHEDSEDAVRDGLLAAARNLNSFEGRDQFSTWLPASSRMPP
jgi:hypothetical protein